MQQLNTGQFYGLTNHKMLLNGLIITDTEYTEEKVDWHYHESPYLTFILQGNVLEGNKKEIHHCAAGDILFHNWQEAHYNLKPPGFTRGFHIELGDTWLKNMQMDLGEVSGYLNIQHPDAKIILYKIFKETKCQDETAPLSIESLLLSLLTNIIEADTIPIKKNPGWVTTLRAMLHDRCCEQISLTELSASLSIHPAHLSRDFPRYFNQTLGQYIRKLKVQKALALLPQKHLSLAEISYECGFADQSHFIRCFREKMNVTPLTYRNYLTH